jgi:hypothetical protein
MHYMGIQWLYLEKKWAPSKLPTLVPFEADPTGDLPHSLVAMEAIRGPSDLLIETYYSWQVANK